MKFLFRASFFKKSASSKIANRIILIIFLPILAGAVFCFSLLFSNRQAVARGISLSQEPVATLSYENLFSFIQQKTDAFNNATIVLVLPSGTTQRVPLRMLGTHADAGQTTDRVFSMGRSDNLVADSITQLEALVRGVDIPYQGEVDDQMVMDFISNNLAQFNRPAQNAQPVYNAQKNSFVIQPELAGMIIDKQQLEGDLKNRIANLSSQEIVLHQQDDFPAVPYAGAQHAETQANALLAKLPLALQYVDGSIPVKQADALAWIDFASDKQNPAELVLSLSLQKIQDYLTLLAPGLNKEPVDARFRIENGKVTAFQLSEQGRSLDIAQTANNIMEALKKNSSLPASATLAFVTINPAITSDSIQNMGITKLLATGTTSFAGSHKTRITNIEIGSSKYDGLLIAPGEEFSFDKILGDVGPEQGYVPELVIKKGKTVPEYGGGLCQVSTTMFRTAVLAGLQITERYNHAYVVRYYGTPGFDATIYPPSPDLKFINNTPGSILIQHQIVGTKLSFEMYGTDDGRKVEVDGPYVYDKQSDGSMKAVLTQKVFDTQGNVMLQKKFYSNYASASLYPVEKNPLE